MYVSQQCSPLRTALLLTALSIASAAGCWRVALPAAAPDAVARPCGDERGPGPFVHPDATHVLVADFDGFSEEQPAISWTIADTISTQLTAYESELSRNKEELETPMPEGSLEVARLPCYLDSHEQAATVARALDADVVIWGQAYRNPVAPRGLTVVKSDVTVGSIATGNGSPGTVGTVTVDASSKPYTIRTSATLVRARYSYHRNARTVHLHSLGNLDLAALRATRPFHLIDFALGLRFYEMGNYALSAELLQRSAEDIYSQERNVEGIHMKLGIAYLYLPDLARSLAHTKRARDLTHGNNPVMKAALLNNMGRALAVQGRHTEALELYREALAIAREALGQAHATVAVITNNIAGVYESLGIYPKALELYHEALAISRQALGPDHPAVAIRLNNIGLVLITLRQHKRALSHFRRALAIDLARSRQDQPTIARRYNNLAIACHRLGNHEEALEYLDKALKHDLMSLGANHPHIVIRRINIGRVLGIQGKHRAALEQFDKAMAIMRHKELDRAHRMAAKLHYNIGKALYASSNYESALGRFREVLAIYQGPAWQVPAWQRASWSGQLEVAKTLNRLGGELMKRGNHVFAVKYFRAALAVYDAYAREPFTGPKARLSTQIVSDNLARALAGRSGWNPDKMPRGAVFLRCKQARCREISLRPGDWLVDYHDTKVQSPAHFIALTRRTTPDRWVRITFVRDGEAQSVWVPGGTLGIVAH